MTVWDATLADIVIRAIDDAGAAKEAERLQEAVWGMPPHEIVPVHQLVTAARWGGMLLIAYSDEEAVGFCYGFVGLDGRQPVLCSHQLGVLGKLRSHGIGYRLKLEQLRLAQERGLDRVVWTFDPLEARNAYLNLHKLDAFAERYYVDAYGPMDDELNKGLPSDRLLVEWLVNEARPSADRPPARLAPSTPVLNPGYTTGAVPRPGHRDVRAVGRHPRLAIAVPADMTAVKKASAEIATGWRLDVREAMTTALEADYRVTDLVPSDEGVSFYLLDEKRR